MGGDKRVGDVLSMCWKERVGWKGERTSGRGFEKVVKKESGLEKRGESGIVREEPIGMFLRGNLDIE